MSAKSFCEEHGGQCQITAEHKQTLVDHESRIRAIEKTMWGILAISSFIAVEIPIGLTIAKML